MEYRDLQYEQSNIGYDYQYPEGGIKCKNYDLCEDILPPDWWEQMANYLCMNCGSWFKIGGFGWDELEFRESEEECAVCNESCNKQVKFPANCGHWFCVSCSRNILFWDETRYYLSPVPFGCLPCPNGCINPIKGKQCHCENYDEILKRWEQENPQKFKAYNNAEKLSIELSETVDGSVFGSKKCPLCRKKYERIN
jgi:hypothetical protein